MLRIASVTLAVVLVVALAAEAGSIYARRRPKRDSIYGDDTAHDVGDLLTVIIEEDVDLQNGIQRKSDRTSSKKLGFSGTYGKPTDPQVFPTLDVQMSGESKFDGKTEYDNERGLDDEVSVMVIDVLPNGNLVVAGRRSRKMDGDDQMMRVSGIVRPSDIQFNNVVYSRRIADFQIVYEGKAYSHDQIFTNPGFVDRFLDFIWPW